MGRFLCFCMLFCLLSAQAMTATNRGNWVELSAGTPVMMVLNQSLDAASVQEGQTLNCKIRQDVVFNQKVLIAHGTAAYARVIEVRFRKRKPKSILVELINTQAVDGQSVNLHSPLIEIQVNEAQSALNTLLQGYVLDNTKIRA